MGMGIPMGLGLGMGPMMMGKGVSDLDFKSLENQFAFEGKIL